MPSRRPLVYWDTCVFVDRIQRTHAKIALLEDITRYAAKGKILIVTSAITIVEVLQGPDKKISKENTRKIQDFFRNSWIDVRQIERKLAEEAAELRRVHRALKTPDAVHLATAISVNAREMHTYDTDLLKLDGCCGNPPLKIIPPAHPESHPLLDQPKKSGR